MGSGLILHIKFSANYGLVRFLWLYLIWRRSYIQTCRLGLSMQNETGCCNYRNLIKQSHSLDEIIESSSGTFETRISEKCQIRLSRPLYSFQASRSQTVSLMIPCAWGILSTLSYTHLDLCCSGHTSAPWYLDIWQPDYQYHWVRIGILVAKQLCSHISPNLSPGSPVLFQTKYLIYRDKTS